VPASPGGQTPLYELGALDDEFEPMFGQLAEFPPWYGAGFEPDEFEPESELEELGCVVDGPLLDELSVCAHATAAPLPSMSPASAPPAMTCLNRMSFTSFRPALGAVWGAAWTTNLASRC